MKVKSLERKKKREENRQITYNIYICIIVKFNKITSRICSLQNKGIFKIRAFTPKLCTDIKNIYTNCIISFVGSRLTFINLKLKNCHSITAEIVLKIHGPDN